MVDVVLSFCENKVNSYVLIVEACCVFDITTCRTVGREFASRPGHTKDHHKNGTNCLPA